MNLQDCKTKIDVRNSNDIPTSNEKIYKEKNPLKLILTNPKRGHMSV